MPAPKQNSVTRSPVLTILMVSTAFILALWPQSIGWLQYDRSAILSGELWRLFTGHWIHFSKSHLLYDAGAVGITGWIIEQHRQPDFKWYCLWAPWLIGSACLIFAPQMELYGGLSGIATGLLVYMSVQGLRETTAWRWICVVLLCGVPIKVYCETMTAHTLFAGGMDPHIEICITSHVAGALSALVWTGAKDLFFLKRFSKRTRGSGKYKGVLLRGGTFPSLNLCPEGRGNRSDRQRCDQLI